MKDEFKLVSPTGSVDCLMKDEVKLVSITGSIEVSQGWLTLPSRVRGEHQLGYWQTHQMLSNPQHFDGVEKSVCLADHL